MSKSVQVYVFERKTPGTYLYKEEGGERNQSGNIYVVKRALGDNPPNKIKVTIEPVD